MTSLQRQSIKTAASVSLGLVTGDILYHWFHQQGPLHWSDAPDYLLSACTCFVAWLAADWFRQRRRERKQRHREQNLNA